MRLVAAAMLVSILPHANATDLWGTWYGVNLGKAQGTVALSLFSDGQYFLNDHGIHNLDPSGQPGIERGTYDWNETTGSFNYLTQIDTDGEWGLSNSELVSIQISGNTLVATSRDEGEFILTRLTDTSSPIVRGWASINTPSPGDIHAIDFLPNGTYMFGGDLQGSTSFLEFGTYSWNSQSGTFEYHVTETTDSSQGFSGSTVSSIKVNGHDIAISLSTGELLAHDVATVPEPGTWMFMVVGFAAMTAFRRHLQGTPS